MKQSTKTSSGVEKLIQRLREEGVGAGEEEAKRLLEKTEQEASQIIAEAKEIAQKLEKTARQEIREERQAACEAVQMAFRDAVLALKDEFTKRFVSHVERMVIAQLQDEEFLRLMILAIAGKVAPQQGNVDILLSEKLFEGEKPREETEERVRHFILGISREMLREGVEFKPAAQDAGLRLQLVGEDLEVDLREEALASLLLQYLVPKYRSFIEGIAT